MAGPRIALYVGDLEESCNEGTLFDLFNAVGPVASVRIVRDHNTSKSLGYGYVNYHNPDDARKAIEQMNLVEIQGKPCRVMYSERDAAKRSAGAGNLIVKNLNETWNDKTLFDAFSIFGKVVSCKVARRAGKTQGYGYVRFEDDESAAKAIAKVNGMKLADHKVIVQRFVPRDQRPWRNVYIKYLPRGFTKDDKTKFEQLFNTPEFQEKVKEEFPTDVKTWTERYGEQSKTLDDPKGGDRELRIPPEPTLITEPKIVSMALWDNDFGVSACVSFTTPAQARAAVAIFNDRELSEEELDKCGLSYDEKTETSFKGAFKRTLFLTRALSRREREKALKSKKAATDRAYTNSIFVSGFSKDVNDEQLTEAFSKFGHVLRAYVVRNRETKESRGFGRVDFESVKDRRKAIEESSGKPFLGADSLFVVKFLPPSLRPKRGGGPRRPRRRPPQVFMQGQFAPGAAQPWQMPGFRQPMPPMFPPFGMAGPGGAPRMAMAPQMMGGNPWMSQMAAFGGMPGRPMFPPMASAMGASAGMPLGSAQAGVTSASVGGPMSRPLGASVGAGPMSSARAIPSSAGMGPGSQPVTEGGAVPSSRLGAMSSAAMRESQPPLTEAALAKTKPGERKRLIGERLFPKIQEIEPRLAGKITGMLLEMDNVELLNILEQPKELMRKINEALAVLREHQMRQSQRNSGKNPSAKQSASGKNPSVGHATT